MNSSNLAGSGPYVDLDRDAWRNLSASTPLPLTDEDLTRLRGLGDPIDMVEANDIYRPISRLLNLYLHATKERRTVSHTFLRQQVTTTPFIIGVAGSVAVGKSTFSRVLKEMMARWPDTPKVDLVTTDGFLYPNDVLAERGLMNRKGFPESFDRRALLQFVSDVKTGVPEVKAPVYDHLSYNILPDAHQVVRSPDVLIIEGLNVLQPAGMGRTQSSLAVSDFFDFSIYVDAEVSSIRNWYVNRFLSLRDTAFTKPESFFNKYASLSDAEARTLAREIWESINEPNLLENIEPTRSRANLILSKGADHLVERVRLRTL